MKTYTDLDLQKLISEVEEDFQKSLNEKAENLTEENEETEETEVTLSKSSDEDHDYDDEDQAEMEKMYKEMTKKEAELHYKAVKKACYGNMAEISKSENEELELVKSENEELKEQNDKLQKSVEQLVTVLKTNVNKAPERKAITNIDYIKKSEVEVAPEVKPFVGTRNDAIKKLRVAASGDDLTKADRQAITEFTLDNKISIDSIKHLLK
jgi:hypothetical protein